MSQDVKPKVTVTKVMPMALWDQSQKAQNAPIKEKSYREKAEDMKQYVALKFLKKRYDDLLHPKQKPPQGSLSTNDNLVRP